MKLEVVLTLSGEELAMLCKILGTTSKSFRMVEAELTDREEELFHKVYSEMDQAVHV
jgi:hypothetical protein